MAGFWFFYRFVSCSVSVWLVFYNKATVRARCEPCMTCWSADYAKSMFICNLAWQNKSIDLLIDLREQGPISSTALDIVAITVEWVVEGHIPWRPQTMTMTVTAMKTWKTNAKCSVKLYIWLSLDKFHQVGEDYPMMLSPIHTTDATKLSSCVASAVCTWIRN